MYPSLEIYRFEEIKIGEKSSKGERKRNKEGERERNKGLCVRKQERNEEREV
jgi:hypothetical protein